jgi:membrane protein DedA with SNARE-associated domain
VTPLELTGLLGWAERVITTLGEWGVGLLVLMETVFPPIPSEVILPLAGFLTSQGSISLPLVVVTATAGAWVGALVLYGLGARLGLERSVRLLAKLPLVDAEDFERAADWFGRHDRSSIFIGRLIPGVRSLISLPAGAQRMPLTTFSLFTLAGSGLWNGVLISLGAALGSQYARVEQYSRFLNYGVWAVLVALVGWLVVRRVRRGRGAGSPTPAGGAASETSAAGEPSTSGSRTPG